MKSLLSVIFLTAIIFSSFSESYRILGFYPFGGKSHFIMIEQLLKGLARKGHRVDVISPFPQKEPYPNYNDIMVYESKLGMFANNVSISSFTDQFRDVTSAASLVGNQLCEGLEKGELLDFIKNPSDDPPYDLIITQVLSYHCFLIIAHLWNVPVVGVSTTSLYPWMHDMIGNPENFAFVPNNLYQIPSGNDLLTRWYNAYLAYSSKLTYYWYTSEQDKILRKHFGHDVPSIRELERNFSLILVNSYFPVNGVSPTTTGLVEVGGLHIQDTGEKLSEDLSSWLDDSREGFIYFSFGSMFRIETLPEKTLATIFQAFEKIRPIRVLLKIYKIDEMPIKLPGNVKSLPWISQEKVLQHRNIKAFITHAGLLGTQESIYYQVPMLCMPLGADQWTNAANYVSRKIAVQVHLQSLTSKDFEHALNEILYNPIYRENMKRVSKLFRDRPHSALETACFWIEYVIRNGKDALRSPSMDLTWWQIALIDVYALTIFLILIFLWIVKFFVNYFVNTFVFWRQVYRDRSKKER